MRPLDNQAIPSCLSSMLERRMSQPKAADRQTGCTVALMRLSNCCFEREIEENHCPQAEVRLMCHLSKRFSMCKHPPLALWLFWSDSWTLPWLKFCGFSIGPASEDLFAGVSSKQVSWLTLESERDPTHCPRGHTGAVSADAEEVRH